MPTVFVVDNGAMRTTPLLQTARDAGFHTLKMANAGMALAVLQAIRADLLLVDLSADATGGSRLIDEIRGKDELRRMPILAVGARPDSEDFRRLKRSVGVGDVIADGGLSHDDLVSEIRKYVATPPEVRGDAVLEWTN